MPENGNAREHNLRAIDTLVFPDSVPEWERDEYRQYLRAHPEDLDFIVDVQELYEFVMASPNVVRETKEQIVAGLKHYLPETGTAYALLVGLYFGELSHAIPDQDGFRSVFKRLVKMHVFGLKSQ